jgi:hypothetical protein
MQINAAAFLLQHPSLSGLTGGSGNSGSRQWQATARSRLYLRPAEAAKDGEHEDGTFVLQTMKLNEGPDGGKVYLRNDNGIWSPAYEDEAAHDWISKAQQERELRARFLDAMLKFEQRGDRLHPHKNQPDYIVKKVAQKTRRNMRDLTRIYEQLLDDGCLVKTTLGSGTRAPQIVVLSEKGRAAAHV